MNYLVPFYLKLHAYITKRLYFIGVYYFPRSKISVVLPSVGVVMATKE